MLIYQGFFFWGGVLRLFNEALGLSHFKIVFDHPNMSLTQHIFYIFWTNDQTKSMLIQITQQLLLIDFGGPHIQIAMGNLSLPVHLRKFCKETKLYNHVKYVYSDLKAGSHYECLSQR